MCVLGVSYIIPRGVTVFLLVTSLSTQPLLPLVPRGAPISCCTATYACVRHFVNHAMVCFGVVCVYEWVGAIYLAEGRASSFIHGIRHITSTCVHPHGSLMCGHLRCHRGFRGPGCSRRCEAAPRCLTLGARASSSCCDMRCITLACSRV